MPLGAAAPYERLTAHTDRFGVDLRKLPERPQLPHHELGAGGGRYAELRILAESP